jgi:hypothetical protein
MSKKNRGWNEGSIHQRANKTWRAQIYKNGQRISKGFQTKAEALGWLRNMHLEMDRGFDIFAGKMRLGEYLLQWLENSGVSLRAKTGYQYGLITRKHIHSSLGYLTPAEFEAVWQTSQPEAGTP